MVRSPATPVGDRVERASQPAQLRRVAAAYPLRDRGQRVVPGRADGHTPIASSVASR